MTPLTDEQAAQDVLLFKALANSVRLQIVSLVAASPEGQVSAGQIVTKFSLSQPTISHHLKILRDAGVLTAHKASTFVYYRFTPQLQEAVASLLPSRPVSAPPIQLLSAVRHRPPITVAQHHPQQEFPPTSPMSAPSFSTAAASGRPLAAENDYETPSMNAPALDGDVGGNELDLEKSAKRSKRAKSSKAAKVAKDPKSAKVAKHPKKSKRSKASRVKVADRGVDKSLKNAKKSPKKSTRPGKRKPTESGTARVSIKTNRASK